MRKSKLFSGLCFLIVLTRFGAFAQDPSDSSVTLALPSASEKWDYFKDETLSPFTPAAGAFNAAVSQLTRSAPLYGRHPWPVAYPKRFGASIGDLVSGNFWGDFAFASAFHEDTRYRRKGESHNLWPRVGYAISRSVVTRSDSGEATFDWANVLGTATGATLSNSYYPRASRTASVTLTNWGTSIAGSGLGNLMPEFLPDFKGWLRRHHL